MLCGSLQIQRFLQIAGRVFILFQVKVSEPRDLPGFRIVWVRGGDLFGFLRGRGKLFLLQELISVICIQGDWRVANRRGRFHVEQRRLPVGCRR